MLKRFAIIALATLLAAGVLVFTVIFGEAPPQGPERPKINANIEPGQLPPPLKIGSSDPTIPSEAGGYIIERTNEKGQLTRITGQHFRPMPASNVEVDNLTTEVYLTPTRVIQVKSDSARMYAPDSQPESGTLTGHVRLTLYECPPDRTVSTDEASRDARLKIFFDEPVRFDLRLGHIESTGNVEVVGSDIHFLGSGLTISYNQLRGRVERLEVARGQELRLRTRTPKGNAPAPVKAPVNQTDATTVIPATPDSTVTTSRPDTPDAPGPSDHSTPTTPDTPSKPTIFYRALFEQRVVVTGDLVKRVDADTLAMLFSLGRTDNQESLLTRLPPPSDAAQSVDSTPNNTTPLNPSPPVQTPTQDQHPAPAHDAQPETNSTPPAESDEIVVHWTGPFVVVPEENPPTELAGPDDSMLMMSGSPLRVTTLNDEVILASDMDYLKSTGRIRVNGSDKQPMMLDSPSLGVLEGERLVIDQSTGIGQIVGPGKLRAINADIQTVTPPSTTPPTPATSNNLSEGLQVKWSDRVDLVFDPQVSADGSPGVGALRYVTFRGNVFTDHPQFELATDKLALSLGDPGTTGPTIQGIDASGSVRVVTHPGSTRRGSQNPADRNLELTSDLLRIAMEHTDTSGDAPTRLEATGHVAAHESGRTLHAGKMEIQLAQAQPPTDAKPPANNVTVSSLTASDNVLVEIDGSATRIEGDRLVTVPGQDGQDQVEIFGSDTNPARMSRDDGSLTGEHIVLSDSGKTAHVVGKGIFTVRTAPQSQGQAASNLTITWLDSMTFNNAVGMARFVGGVVSDGYFGKDTSRLTCDDLRIDFVPGSLEEANAVEKPVGEGAQRVLDNFHSINHIQADGNAVLLASRWSDHPGGTLGSRLRITGPTIFFDSLPQQLQVVGVGTMFVEDYRPDDAQRAASPDDAAVGKTLGVTIAGRGATLFTWSSQMQIDMKYNDLRIFERVQMLHRGAGQNKPVQLDCQYFEADLEATGGIGVWASGNAPQPRLQTITARNSVRIRSGDKTILCDEMRYRGVQKTVTLLATQGRRCSITQENISTPLTAEQFKWDLVRDRIEIEHPGRLSR
ncbi:MAG: hypothetical protein GC164_11750 [Phycisphaera sp.]|nr:hypothetical protein [Phycisphaera sp.]